MDIWRWLDDVFAQYRDENPRLLWLMFRLPGIIVDNEHDIVDALMPEALALAKETQNPWIEVYMRHWDLQSRILHRSLIKQSLPDAVDLLERVHREDAIGCPQAVCVSQDVCVAYGRSDGPGFAEERLKVSTETLERINPTWPCWRCISCEHASALLDQERYQDALDFVEQQLTAIRKEKPGTDPYGFRDHFVEAYIGLGRLEEALAFNTNAEHDGLGESFVVEKRIDQSRILSLLGRHEEAAAILPRWSEVEKTPSDFYDWLHGAYLLAKHDAWKENVSPLPLMIKAARQLYEQGVIRQSIEILHWAAELALALPSLQQAEKIADRIASMHPDLHRPLDAPDRLEALRAAIASVRDEGVEEAALSKRFV